MSSSPRSLPGVVPGGGSDRMFDAELPHSPGGSRVAPLRFDVLTIFPDYLKVLELSLIGKAAQSELLSVGVHDLRDWTTDRHRTVDDTPLGGGAGMVMKPDIWGKALDDVLGLAARELEADDRAAAASEALAARPGADAPGDANPQAEPVGAGNARPKAGRQVLIIPTPAGSPFTQRVAEDLVHADQIVFACGRYEGPDSRIARHYREQGVEVRELSIGDYVLNGGEVASVVMIEAIARLHPGVLGNPESVVEESHSTAGLLEYEVYTRPVSWRGQDIAEQWPGLLSGNHARIARERRDQAIIRTAQRRPDMIARLDPVSLDSADRALLARLGWATPHGVSNPQHITIAEATMADAEELQAFAARIFPDACPPFLSEDDIAAHIANNLTLERFDQWIADPRALLKVVRLREAAPVTGAHGVREAETSSLPAGSVVGYSLTILDDGEPPVPGLDLLPACVPTGEGPTAELSKVYVDPAMRGSGVAGALVQRAVREASAHGASVLWLGTYEGNKAAQRAYKRQDLRKVGTRHFTVGGQRCRDIVMARELPLKPTFPGDEGV